MSHKFKIITGILSCLLLEGAFYFLARDLRVLFVLSIAGVISFIFLYSLWTGKSLPAKWFLCCVIVLSLSWLSFIFDYGNLDSLFMSDDHPKFFAFTSQNAQLLLKHGTPFGFNHYFQGGIPTLYLRSCFLEYIPFLLLWGDQTGYQVMLLFFLILIPVSLYFLIREITKDENVARTVSFLSAFQFGTWPSLWCGNTPIIIAMPLVFFSFFFFIRYFYYEKTSLFPVVFFSGLLMYTHLLAFVIAWLGFGIFFGYKLAAHREFSKDFKKMAVLAFLSILVGLPLLEHLIKLSSFFTPNWRAYYPHQTLMTHIKIASSNLIRAAHIRNPLFLSILFLGGVWGLFSRRRIIVYALLFSIGVYGVIAFKDVKGIEVLIYRIEGQFMSYIAIMNFSLFMLLRFSRRAKALWVVLLILFVYKQFLPGMCTLPAVKSVKEVDSAISSLIEPDDYVLFEHCAHQTPGRKGDAFERRSIHCCHWGTHLQRFLGVKFFSHMGDDPHTYSRLKHMYLNSGFYKGKRLGQKAAHGEEFLTLLKDWGVTKACVWTKTAKRFFDQTQDFQLLGQSEKYQCYAAVYPVLPPVRLSQGGTAKLLAEKPFSFVVDLKDLSQKQTAIINKNYFDLWSAVDEEGKPIELRNCGQMICFDAEQNGRIFFRYQKNILLNIISVLTLLAVLVQDFVKKRRQIAGRNLLKTKE